MASGSAGSKLEAFHFGDSIRVRRRDISARVAFAWKPDTIMMIKSFRFEKYIKTIISMNLYTELYNRKGWWYYNGRRVDKAF